MSLSIFYGLIAFFFFAFPDESSELFSVSGIWVRLMFLNAELLIRSYLVYRKLRADMEAMNLQAPPFRFTRIRHRD